MQEPMVYADARWIDKIAEYFDSLKENNTQQFT